MPEITLIIDPQSSEPIFIQIYRYVKENIEKGRFTPETRLPSIRKTASHLQINKNTIDSAYQQLLADGYIYSKPKSGDFCTGLKCPLRRDVPFCNGPRIAKE